MWGYKARLIAIIGISASLGACTNIGNLDLDLRGKLGQSLDTSSAAKTAVAPLKQADSRGIITYPTYQVAVARQGDTIDSLAARVGADANVLSKYNGIKLGTTLRAGELVSLPKSSNSNGSATSGQTASIVDVSELGPTSGTTKTYPEEPVQHQVEPGETAYTISRLYGVPVAKLADFNGLGADYAVRNGQRLIIPVITSPGAAPQTQPGQGSPTPTPPSSVRPNPRTDATALAPVAPAVAAPDLGPSTVAPPTSAMTAPVNGSIIRDYNKGKNDGVDIGAAAGTKVVAADTGTVAAVTKDTGGVTILVIKHKNNLLTVYTNIDSLTVKKGDAVKRGQTVGKVAAGNPSFVHFEVRKGLNAVDPNDYI